MNIGLMILAGGKSRRMGDDKAFLPLGGKSFLSRMIEKGKRHGFAEILAVMNQEWIKAPEGVTVVRDIYPHCGPLSGMHAGLSRGKSEVYFVVSCDMPFLDMAVAETLRPHLKDGALAAAPVHEGRLQPLAALYRAECAAVIEKMLRAEREYRLQKLYERIKAERVPCGEFSRGFFNVNTPASYIAAQAREANSRRKIPVVTIAAARSGTGKTTLLEKLIPALKQRGLRIAVLKSDGHGFDFDRPGKDTFKFSSAGADAVAIVGPDRYAVMQRTPAKEPLENVARKITGVDLILIESRAHGIFPVLEILRAGYSENPATEEEKLAAVITDMEGLSRRQAVLPLHDPAAVASFILSIL